MNNLAVLRTEIFEWYQSHARHLPWRQTRDPYKIWISEVMLQQTTVKAVIPYYQRWIKQYPTVKDVACSSSQQILKSWQGLGYYQRARNIQRAAKIICKNFRGKIPREMEALRRLPGFGPYTAGAVASIAFDRKHPIIDANIRRVVMRLLALQSQTPRLHEVRITTFLLSLLPQRGSRILNQALMELGALVCRSRTPLCLTCPVKTFCRAYRKGIQEVIPRIKQTKIKSIHAVVAVIEKQGRFFIQRRPSQGLLADLWEFPGGKVQKGESVRKALEREVSEEIGVRVVSAQQFMKTRHYYTQFCVQLDVWCCQCEPEPVSDSFHKWVTLTSLVKYPMPSGSAKIVDQLKLRPQRQS